jgi:hypothetical protein
VKNDVFPQEYQDILSDEKRAFAFLGTIMEDGTPQVTPVRLTRMGSIF